jgi:hypothetical protein
MEKNMIGLSEIINAPAAEAERLHAVCLLLQVINENYLNTLFEFDSTFRAVFPEKILRSRSPCRGGSIHSGKHKKAVLCDPLLFAALKENRDIMLVRQQLSLFNSSLTELQRCQLISKYFSGHFGLTRAKIMERYAISRRTYDRELRKASAIMIHVWHLDKKNRKITERKIHVE